MRKYLTIPKSKIFLKTRKMREKNTVIFLNTNVLTKKDLVEARANPILLIKIPTVCGINPVRIIVSVPFIMLIKTIPIIGEGVLMDTVKCLPM